MPGGHQVHQEGQSISLPRYTQLTTQNTGAGHRPVYVGDDVKWPEFIFHIKFGFKGRLYFDFLLFF